MPAEPRKERTLADCGPVDFFTLWWTFTGAKEIVFYIDGEEAAAGSPKERVLRDRLRAKQKEGS